MKNTPQKFKKRIIALVVAVLFLIIHLYVGQPAFLRSYISMYPTLHASDVLFVNKIALRLDPPKRGDVILAVERNGEHRDMPKDRFVRLLHPFYWNKANNIIAIASFGPFKPTNVKRIIGMPGETIEIIDKQVFINGEKYVHGSEVFVDENIFESFLCIEYDFEMRVNMPSTSIPDRYYFLLGDHRDLSRDSRTFGLVHEDDIRGKISMLIYSRRDDKIRWFKKV